MAKLSDKRKFEINQVFYRTMYSKGFDIASAIDEALEYALEDHIIPTEEEVIAAGEGDLSNTNVIAPLTYSLAQKKLYIAPPPNPNQAYRWNGTEWVPFTVEAYVRFIEHRTLTLQEEQNKKLILQNEASDLSKMIVDVADGGGAQFIGTDFTVTNGTDLSWDGLSLDGLLKAGDRIRIIYE